MKEEKFKTASFTDEDGNEYELEVIKEFEHNNKHYAVLYDEGDNNIVCDCEDECPEECTCGCHDEDEDDARIYVLEVTNNDDGAEVYQEVDENILNELIPIIEKELYPTE